jgi:glycosyltransferase involved in cell wall biosynthesis
MKEIIDTTNLDGGCGSFRDKNNIPRKKTRLMVIAPFFYPKIGGLENYAYNIARRFHESGDYDVTVVSSNYQTKNYIKEIIDEITIYRLPVWFKVSNTPINPMWYCYFKRIFSDERPDIVNIHSPVPFMADVAVLALKKQIPTVLTYHSGSMLKNKFPADFFIYFYEKIFLPVLFRQVKIIVAVSENFFVGGLGKAFINKTRLIRPGVDTIKYSQSPIPVDSKIVSYVGRVEHSSSWKGIEELLHSMVLVVQQHSDAKLEIIGGGDAIEHFRLRAERLGISKYVTMLGPLVGKELIDAYQRSSVFVLPSTSEAEQSSVALIEAMASGRPVIGTNIGGTPKIIRNSENGLLVEPKDAIVLAEAIKRLLSDKKFAESLGNGARADAQKVDWAIQIKKYQDLFRSILLK